MTRKGGETATRWKDIVQHLSVSSTEFKFFGAFTGWAFSRAAHRRRQLDRLNEEQPEEVVLPR